MMKSKVCAFLVDGSNMYATTKALGFDVDFKKLLNQFDGTVLKAYYFTALPPETEQSSFRPMVDWMEYNGYTVFQKEYKEYSETLSFECPKCGVTHPHTRPKIKGNMDIEIATIAFEIAPYVSDIYLFSGDGDFTFLVQSLQRRFATTVTVVSSIKTRPSMCADNLRRAADNFIEVMDIREDVERPRERRFPRSQA